jgi:hypothetical protein
MNKNTEKTFKRYIRLIEDLSNDVSFSVDNDFKDEWLRSSKELKETKRKFLEWFKECIK